MMANKQRKGTWGTGISFKDTWYTSFPLKDLVWPNFYKLPPFGRTTGWQWKLQYLENFRIPAITGSLVVDSRLRVERMRGGVPWRMGDLSTAPPTSPAAPLPTPHRRLPSVSWHIQILALSAFPHSGLPPSSFPHSIRLTALACPRKAHALARVSCCQAGSSLARLSTPFCACNSPACLCSPSSVASHPSSLSCAPSFTPLTCMYS